MAYSLIAHAPWDGTGPNNGQRPTAARNITGADLVVFGVAVYNRAPGTGGGTPAFDSLGSTFFPLTSYNGGAGSTYSRLYWARVTGGGAGYIVTYDVNDGTGEYAGTAMMAFSGSVASPFDLETGAGQAASSTQAPGPLTPSETNCLVALLGGSKDDDYVSQNDGTFTILEAIASAGGTNCAIALGYRIQTTAAAVNPLFTFSAAGTIVAQQASFKDTPSGGAPSLVWMPTRQTGPFLVQ